MKWSLKELFLLHVRVTVCLVSDRISESLREPDASGQAGRNQSVRDGVRGSSRRDRFLTGGGAGKARLSQSTAFYYDHHRRRLLY